MTPLLSLLTLTTGYSLWALFCFGVYLALRALTKWAKYPMVYLGLLSLAFWVLGFAAITFLCGSDGDSEGMQDPYPLFELIGMALTMFIGLVGGGALVRVASQRQVGWRQGILFCATHLVIIHGLFMLLLNRESIFLTLLSRARTGIGLVSYSETMIIGFIYFLWIFPLCAPCLEMMVRSFRRAWQQHRTGTYAR